MLDDAVADAFFEGDVEAAMSMFDQLDPFDISPMDCGYFPPGMSAADMGDHNMHHPDGMDHSNIGPDGMTMAIDPAACEAATATITEAGIDPRELADMFMFAGPESDPMPKLADAHFDADIEAAIALMDGLSQTNTDPVMCGHIEPPM